jgi:hypothetical protein
MTHLSSEQISAWILGERRPEVERHFNTCGRCREDIIHLQEGLLVFKQSMRDWAEQSATAGTADTVEIVSLSRPRNGLFKTLSWTWAAVAALVIGVGLLPLYLDARRARHDAEIAQDTLLLNQVEARLARTVPRSMEQLLELMHEGTGGPQ